MAGTNWEARPQRTFLGLSLLTHFALFGLGTAAFVWGAVGRQAAPRSFVTLALQDAQRISAANPAPSEPDPPPLEVESASLEEPELPPTEPEPTPPAPEPEPAPLDAFPALPRSWSAARLEPRPAEPPVSVEPRQEPEPPVPQMREEPQEPEEAGASASVLPTLLDAPPPVYPSRARRLGQEGSVDCLLAVEADGSVSSVRVLRSSGFEALDDAARRALVRWRFLPGLRLGRPDAFEVEHRVTFVLD